MKKITLFRYARLIFITLFLAGVFFLYGCTTFGTFSSLKQNISTNNEVRELLGEPEQIRSEEDHDIWKYTFVEPSKRTSSSTSQKVLETEISFRDGVMTDYQIIVVNKTIPENERRNPIEDNMRPGIRQGMQPGVGPNTQKLDPKARRFLERYDTNKDGQITKPEYIGPPKLFILLDSNHNSIIDFFELNNFFRER